MFRIQDVIKLLTKIFVKRRKRFPIGMESIDIRIKAKKIHDIGKANDYKGAISEDQLKQFLAIEEQQLKRVPTRVIPAESAEGKIITDKITGKNVIKFPGGGVDKVPVTKQFTGESFSADDHIKFIKSKEPIESMKEANSVIGRKGRYKNLTHEEADQILKDVDDHIFQRDVVPDEFDPDYASGGRIGFGAGKIVKGGRWFLKMFKKAQDEMVWGSGNAKSAFHKLPSEEKARILQESNALIKRIEGGGAIPDEFIQKMKNDPNFKLVDKTKRSPDPDLAEVEDLVFGVDPEIAFAEAQGKIFLKGPQKMPPSHQENKILDAAYEDVAHHLKLEDLKYEADVLADSYANQLGKVYDDMADAERSVLYDQSYKRLASNLRVQMDIKKIDQKVILSEFDTKGRKPNQSGGLAYMLGEPTYSNGRTGAEGGGYLNDNELQSGGLAAMLGEPTYREPMLWGGTPRIKKAIEYIRNALRSRGIKRSRTGKTFHVIPERDKRLGKIFGIEAPQKSSSALAESIVEKLKMDLKHIKQREKVAEGIASTIHTAPGMEKTPKGYKDYIEKSLIRMFDKSSEIKDIEKNLGIMEIIQRKLSGRKLNAEGGRIGYGAGDFVKKITKRFSEDRTKEDIGKWLKEKDVDLTVEEWRSKPLKEKLKLWAWKFQPFYTGELEKGQDYESGGRIGLQEGSKSDWDEFQKQKLRQLFQEYQQYMENRGKGDQQRPYTEERMGIGPGPILEAAQGGRIGFKEGESLSEKITRWGLKATGGRNLLGGELGLEGLHQLYQVLGMGGLYAEGGRIGFEKGGFDPSKRTFLKIAAGLASLPILGKFFKWAKPAAKAVKTLTSVPIKNIEGMPLWFKPLVNRVIKEGDDVTKGYATVEREIVHTIKLPNSNTDVLVTQNLDSGDVLVDIGLGKHGWRDGRYGQPARLEYKASEVIEPTHIENIKRGERFEKTGKATKTKEEFWVDEAEFTGGHPENVKFEESVTSKYGEHASDFTEVEKFATGKVSKKSKSVGKGTEWEADYDDSLPDYEDFSSGGRVPLDKGGLLDWPEYMWDFYMGLLPGAEKRKYKEWLENWDVTGQTKHASGGRVPLAGGGGLRKLIQKALAKLRNMRAEDIFDARGKVKGFKKPEDYIMDVGWKAGKYYKKHPEKGLEHATAVATGVLAARHLERKKKVSGGLAGMLGE